MTIRACLKMRFKIIQKIYFFQFLGGNFSNSASRACKSCYLQYNYTTTKKEHQFVLRFTVSFFKKDAPLETENVYKIFKDHCTLCVSAFLLLLYFWGMSCTRRIHHMHMVRVWFENFLINTFSQLWSEINNWAKVFFSLHFVRL